MISEVVKVGREDVWVVHPVPGYVVKFKEVTIAIYGFMLS